MLVQGIIAYGEEQAVTMTLQYTGVPDQLTKFPGNSLIGDRILLLSVTECGNLAASWKHATLITRKLCVLLHNKVGSPP